MSNLEEKRESTLNSVRDRLARNVLDGRLDREDLRRDIDYVFSRTAIQFLMLGGSSIEMTREYALIFESLDDMIDEALTSGAIED